MQAPPYPLPRKGHFVMAKTVKRVRDARTGQYVPKREAERRPSTTVTETDKVRPRKKGK